MAKRPLKRAGTLRSFDNKLHSNAALCLPCHGDTPASQASDKQEPANQIEFAWPKRFRPPKKRVAWVPAGKMEHGGVECSKIIESRTANKGGTFSGASSGKLGQMPKWRAAAWLCNALAPLGLWDRCFCTAMLFRRRCPQRILTAAHARSARSRQAQPSSTSLESPRG